jgi:hypothetical protein
MSSFFPFKNPQLHIQNPIAIVYNKALSQKGTFYPLSSSCSLNISL